MRDTLRLSVLDKDDLKLINKKEKKQAKADQKEKKVYSNKSSLKKMMLSCHVLSASMF